MSSIVDAEVQDITPSCEAVLISALTRAFVRQLPRRRRAAFISDVRDHLEILCENVVGIHMSSVDRVEIKARREALAWWKRAMALL